MKTNILHYIYKEAESTLNSSFKLYNKQTIIVEYIFSMNEFSNFRSNQLIKCVQIMLLS